MPDKIGPFAGEQFEPDEAFDRLVRGNANTSSWDAPFGIAGNGTGTVLDGRTGFSSEEAQEVTEFWAMSQMMFLYNPWDAS